jgi:GrpB-like predicted nucleotidyltransferase (UPF0157 family)
MHMGGGDGKALDEYLDRVLIGGREERAIRVVEYSELWPRRFETERRRIEGLLGETARRVEHVGSTAVAGLAAKPIMDIMVTVDDPDDESAYVRQLELSAMCSGFENRGTACSERRPETSTYTSGRPGAKMSVGTWRSATGCDQTRWIARSTNERSGSWDGGGT